MTRPSSRPAADNRPLRRVGEEGVAPPHRADRSDQVLVGLTLENVSGGARLERLEQIALVVVHGEHQHAGLGEVGADLASGLQAREPGHPHIEDAQVRALLQRLLECLHAVARLGDDLEVRLALEQELDSRSHDAVVVGYEDAHLFT